MFDMQQMGIRISNLRKAAQLTQTELADRLGISFQAVSNWERGLSMPDISKLAELASLLNVTVDALLGGEPGGQTVRLLEKQPAGDVPVGEIQEIAPILHTDQVETLLGDTAGKPIDADAIASLAPYLSQSFIDDCAEKLLQANGSLHAIAKLAPFVSTSFLDEKAEEALRQTGSLDAIRAVAPFLSEALLDRLAETAFWETPLLFFGRYALRQHGRSQPHCGGGAAAGRAARNRPAPALCGQPDFGGLPKRRPERVTARAYCRA